MESALGPSEIMMADCDSESAETQTRLDSGSDRAWTGRRCRPGPAGGVTVPVIRTQAQTHCHRDGDSQCSSFAPLTRPGPGSGWPSRCRQVTVVPGGCQCAQAAAAAPGPHGPLASHGPGPARARP